MNTILIQMNTMNTLLVKIYKTMELSKSLVNGFGHITD